MPTEPFHRLFVAVRPPADVIPVIAALRDWLGPDRNVVADERLHLTTWLFDDSQDFPAHAATRARAVLDRMKLPRFRIVLDRLVGGKGHVVLLPSETLAGFVAFQRQLDLALTEAGLTTRPYWRFSPHVTLGYGRQDIDQWIDPISWQAEEIVLIDSIVGARRHDVIARWPLD